MLDCKTVYTPESVVREVNLVYFGGKHFFHIYCRAVKPTAITTNIISNKKQLNTFWVTLNIMVIWLLLKHVGDT